MPRKIYKSFAQIDQELEMLSMQKQLGMIKVRQAGNKLFTALSPSNLLLDSLGSLGSYLRNSDTLQKTIIMILLRKFFK
jgi:hypothetical protein